MGILAIEDCNKPLLYRLHVDQQILGIAGELV